MTAPQIRRLGGLVLVALSTACVSVDDGAPARAPATDAAEAHGADTAVADVDDGDVDDGDVDDGDRIDAEPADADAADAEAVLDGTDADRDAADDVEVETDGVDANARDATTAGDVADDADRTLAERARDATTAIATGLLLSEDPLRYVDGAWPYSVAAPLYSDGSAKRRAVFVPPGGRVWVAADGSVAWPEGTVLAKWFVGAGADGTEHPIELRLLIRGTDQWEARSFVWNSVLGDAPRVVDELRLWLDGTPAQWSKPAETQCVVCHGPEPMRPLATDVRQLHHTGDGGDLLQRLAAAGLLDGEVLAIAGPPTPTTGDAGFTVEAAARAALHGQCAHCHRAGGSAGRGGLWLGWSVDSASRLGVCVDAPAGGPTLDGATRLIVPGVPEQSVLWRRMVDPRDGVRMPEFGAMTVDRQSADAVAAWIRAMPAGVCPD